MKPKPQSSPQLAPQLALCAAVELTDASQLGGATPEWVMLLPAGDIRTVDGRGPYKVPSMTALATALNAADKKLPIDECHATDLAQKNGQPAPARAWMNGFEERDGALWANVGWTPSGAQLMAERAYIGLSPVITHLKDGTVVSVLRASLTNTPNLTGLTALHSEEDQTMDWKAKLVELLGLDGEADDAAISAALTAKLEAKPAAALCSEAGEPLNSPAVIALQSELGEVSSQLKSLQDATALKDAAAFVDAAIAAGRVGVKPLRDEYIALHISDPARAAKMIGAQPVITGTTRADGLAPDGEENGLDAADRQVIALMGVSEEDYIAALSADGTRKEAL